tara:strand:+ start:525 stop:710 length:186 start_codon:yes stop_codon:yes gene_type:complete
VEVVVLIIKVIQDQVLEGQVVEAQVQQQDQQEVGLPIQVVVEEVLEILLLVEVQVLVVKVL